jgi:acyl-CoA synthetase (AMP-forming)/AMP-acid ligase II
MLSEKSSRRENKYNFLKGKNDMPITDFLEKNAKLHPDEVALVEVNPANQPDKNLTWHEYNLIEATVGEKYRCEITWREFDIAANRFANLLLTRGVKKGDKVAILMMNCIDWLPIYFGILKAGALAVPMNFRFSAEEIEYCSDLADVSVLVFGPEFTERLEKILPRLEIKHYFFVGDDAPDFADCYRKMIGYCSSVAPAVEIAPGPHEIHPEPSSVE